MRGADGRLLGILSVDEPISGRKPSGDEIDVLVAVSEHAALAVQAAQEATRAKANRDALERLLAVSASPERDRPTRASCCSTCARRSPRRSASRRSPCSCSTAAPASTRSVAAVGFDDGREHRRAADAPTQLERLLQPEFDVAGCFLIPARRGAPARCRSGPPATARSGTAAARIAWQNDWLFVPLHDRRGAPHRLHLGRRPARPPASRARAPADPARVREPGDDRARAGRRSSRRSRTRYEHHRALIDASPVAIVDFDLDGRVRSWNDGATEIFGWTAEEAIGRVNPTVPEDELAFFLDNMAAHPRRARRCATSTCAACTATAR